MSPQGIAAYLFEKIEKVGQEAPTLDQVAATVADAVSESEMEAVIMLQSAGFGKAADYLERIHLRKKESGE